MLVYILYIIFQLKSHSYLYASIPQKVIDEESHPGILAELMNSSSDSSSSSSDESDDTTTSWTTAKRIKRAMKSRRRRKSSTSSKGTASRQSIRRKTLADIPQQQTSEKSHSVAGSFNGHQDDTGSCAIDFRDDARYDADDSGRRLEMPHSRDFGQRPTSAKAHKKDRKAKKAEKRKRRSENMNEKQNLFVASHPLPSRPSLKSYMSEPSITRDDLDRHDDIADIPKRRSAFLPAMPALLSNTVFSSAQSPSGTQPSGSAPRMQRSNSLPGRINRPLPVGNAVQYARGAARVPNAEDQTAVQASPQDPEPEMSRTAAIVMLILSTGLVAVCAEFLVDAIPAMIESSNVSEAFIGLIILPIVGNAAEHVTAVSVATKNKMDLSIGVSVGSSIQIGKLPHPGCFVEGSKFLAIFVTPLVVILGWCMDKDMSLYFTLFETICLFVTAFVVNFLVLDGRSNYLEGSLLIAAYVIIAYVPTSACVPILRTNYDNRVATFFYPDQEQSSEVAGPGVY